MRAIGTTYQPKQYTQGGKPSGTGMLYLNINDSI
jgi:hypothetical protein